MVPLIDNQPCMERERGVVMKFLLCFICMFGLWPASTSAEMVEIDLGSTVLEYDILAHRSYAHVPFTVPLASVSIDSMHAQISGYLPEGWNICGSGGYWSEFNCPLQMRFQLSGYDDVFGDNTHVGFAQWPQEEYSAVVQFRVVDSTNEYEYHSEAIPAGGLTPMINSEQLLNVVLQAKEYYGYFCGECHTSQEVIFSCKLFIYYSDSVANEMNSWGCIKRLYR